MMNNSIMRRYWVLFSCLFIVFPWGKWMLFLGLAVAVIGVPIYGIWASSAGFIVGGLIVFLLVFVNATALPHQMLSVASSKQIGFLPDIRRASCYVFALTCLCISIAIAGLISIKEQAVAIHEFWAIFCLLSAVLMGCVLVGQKYPGAQALIFITFWFLPRAYQFLLSVHLGVLVVVGLMAWLAFFRQWLDWRPSRFHQNIFSLSQEQLIAFNRQRFFQSNGWVEKLDNFLAVKPATLVGSLLLGRADGVKARWITASFIFLTMLIVIGMCYAKFDLKIFREIFAVGGQVNIYLVYFGMINGILMGFFRNIHKAWLYFDGSRERYFTSIERIFFRFSLAFIAPVVLIHSGTTYFLLDWMLYHELVWLTVIYSLIVIALTFYINLFIYHKTKGSIPWSRWVGVLLMIVSIIPVAAYNVLWVDHKAQIIYLAYFFVVASILVIFALRQWIKKQWISVDLVRVKS